MKKIHFRKNFESGFTLLELLVVVAIIGILTAVVLVSSTDARNKGIDAGVKSNLASARQQGEIFYNTNTAAPSSYTNVCTNGPVGGAIGIGSAILAAAKANRLSGYAINPPSGGTLATATCNDNADGWAAEAPLTTVGHVWCVDSTSAAREETVSIGTNTACN